MTDDIPEHLLLTREQAAWTLDNRGSLTVVVKTKRGANGQRHVYFHPRFRVVDKNLDALELLHAQFGGSVVRHSRRHYAWEIGQSVLAALLEDVMPYINEKRRQAELILKLIETKEAGGERDAQREIVEELWLLNAQN